MSNCIGFDHFVLVDIMPSKYQFLTVVFNIRILIIILIIMIIIIIIIIIISPSPGIHLKQLVFIVICQF